MPDFRTLLCSALVAGTALGGVALAPVALAPVALAQSADPPAPSLRPLSPRCPHLWRKRVSLPPGPMPKHLTTPPTSQTPAPAGEAATPANSQSERNRGGYSSGIACSGHRHKCRGPAGKCGCGAGARGVSRHGGRLRGLPYQTGRKTLCGRPENRHPDG
ncbi:2-Keto-D-gluconate dehydrogenase, membrane-bound, cytochrome c [Acetobacter malorum]|uniref:2-Keto-D-gluconate dehydrogenase, membrane-bound, cytochrome c n=1 Tax=Acetobacter malorum TaxID=178901 RepID=A0A177GDU2_9PROT|nr:hypothetical protein [Acetobacter malorum]OAG78412.1 2-Keto-D-gluconate dehydrogenase, membrane-bound, cytochrome c [Acetobacter malorum]